MKDFIIPDRSALLADVSDKGTPASSATAQVTLTVDGKTSPPVTIAIE